MRHATAVIVLGGLLLWPCLAPAQRPESPQSARQDTANRTIPTEVSFELLLSTGSAALHAQDWGSLLERAGATVRIRQPLGEEQPETSESRRGRTRYVLVRGILERDGSAVFADRTLSPRDAGRIREWVRELKTYGAQGSTEGKPGFGLSPQQFEQVFQTLEGTVTVELDGRDLASALEGIGLTSRLPLRLSAATTEHLQTARPGAAPAGLKGLSRGTALAIVLNAAGLGFQPGRTPAGTLELVIVPQAEQTAVWPVGWPLDKPPLHAFPKLLAFEPVEIDDEPLTTLLARLETRAETPLIIDTRRIAAAGIKLDETRVSYGPKRSTWRTALDQVLFPRLMAELLQDEAGRPFLWITTNSVKQLNERSQQREIRQKLLDEQ